MTHRGPFQPQPFCDSVNSSSGKAGPSPYLPQCQGKQWRRSTCHGCAQPLLSLVLSAESSPSGCGAGGRWVRESPQDQLVVWRWEEKPTGQLPPMHPALVLRQNLCLFRGKAKRLLLCGLHYTFGSKNMPRPLQTDAPSSFRPAGSQALKSCRLSWW